jgi:hypothetical protein
MKTHPASSFDQKTTTKKATHPSKKGREACYSRGTTQINADSNWRNYRRSLEFLTRIIRQKLLGFTPATLEGEFIIFSGTVFTGHCLSSPENNYY